MRLIGCVFSDLSYCQTYCQTSIPNGGNVTVEPLTDLPWVKPVNRPLPDRIFSGCSRTVADVGSVRLFISTTNNVFLSGERAVMVSILELSGVTNPSRTIRLTSPRVASRVQRNTVRTLSPLFGLVMVFRPRKFGPGIVAERFSRIGIGLLCRKQQRVLTGRIR